MDSYDLAGHWRPFRPSRSPRRDRTVLGCRTGRPAVARWSPATYPFNMTGHRPCPFPSGVSPAGSRRAAGRGPGRRRRSGAAFGLPCASNRTRLACATRPRNDQPPNERKMIMPSSQVTARRRERRGRPSSWPSRTLDDRQAAAAERVEGGTGRGRSRAFVFCDPPDWPGPRRCPRTFPRGTAQRHGLQRRAFLFDTGHRRRRRFPRGLPAWGSASCWRGDFCSSRTRARFRCCQGQARTGLGLGNEFCATLAHPLASPMSCAGLRRVRQARPGRGIGLEVEWYLTRLTGGPTGNVETDSAAEPPPRWKP